METFYSAITFLSVALAVPLLGILGATVIEAARSNDLRDKLGLTQVHPGLLIIGLTLYAAIALLLFAGLIILIAGVIALPFSVTPDPSSAEPEATDQNAEYLFYVLRIAGLTTVLGAVIALPFTIIRLRLTQRQTDTATEALFNDKMTAATTDLYSRRQTADGTGWQDDVPRRNSAIDRLEGLVNERPEEAPRVARLLSVYVRELSGPGEVPAKRHPYMDAHDLMHPKDNSEPMSEEEALAHLDKTPDDISLDALKTWARALTARSDMETAVQTLGRLRGKDGVAAKGIVIDLRGANLQGIDLEGGNFRNARMNGAQLQGANLRGAKLQRANLRDAQLQGANLGDAQLQGAILWGAGLQGADLWGAQLQGADLTFAQLQGAKLWGAQLQGAKLWGAQFDAATSLTAATLRGAAVSEVDFTTIPQIAAHLTDIFGDASVTLPGGVNPDHPDWPPKWSKEKINYDDFETAWRAWQATLPPGWYKS